MKNKIYLARHGLDDENYIGGWSSGDLITEGISQVENLAQFILHEKLYFDKIITSDLKRAVSTAEILATYLKLEIILENSLRELNKGIISGMKLEVARREYPKYLSKLSFSEKYPKGESKKDFYKRVKNYIENNHHKLGNNLLITHRGFINFVYKLCEVSFDYDSITHGSLHEFDYGKQKVKRIY